MTVYESDGTTQVTSSLSTSHSFSVGAAGTYYVKVAHSSSSGTGAYTIALQN